MFTIGDLAGHGRVRPYDTIGLLRPARVDPASGYRAGEAAQHEAEPRHRAEVPRVHVAAGPVDPRPEGERTARHAPARGAGSPPGRGRRAVPNDRKARDSADVVVKRIVPRTDELTGTVQSYEPEDIGPVIQPLARAGVAVTGSCIAYHEDSPERTVTVHPCLPVAVAPSEKEEFAVVDLPAIESAATIVHRGSMAGVLATERPPGTRSTSTARPTRRTTGAPGSRRRST